MPAFSSAQLANAADVWDQVGSDIEGLDADDRLGWDVATSADGSIVAVSSVRYDNPRSNVGLVQVFEFGSGSWTQLGSNFVGSQENNNFGSSVALSSDGSTLAIGASCSDGSGASSSCSGEVQVFSYSSGSWTQVGSDIEGSAGEGLGFDVAISSDGTRVAAGAPWADLAGTNDGLVRVYEYSGGSWSQLGSDVNGEASGDLFGRSVDINSSGSSFVAGGPGNTSDVGHARVTSCRRAPGHKLAQTLTARTQRKILVTQCRCPAMALVS